MSELTLEGRMVAIAAAKHRCVLLQAQLESTNKQLESANQQLASANKQLASANQQLMEMTNKVTLEAFCQRYICIHDNSESTAHINKGKKGAEKETIAVALIDLPPEFWTSYSGVEYIPGQCTAQNEAHVTIFFGQLVRAVVDALKSIGYLQETNSPDVVPQVNLMDVIPDLSIMFGGNRYLGATIEMKKHVKGQLEETFGNNGIGQAFEQLYLSKLGLSGNSYGFISTYNSVLLVSTGNLEDDMRKLIECLRANKNLKPTNKNLKPADSGGTTKKRIHPRRQIACFCGRFE
jgi:hypothetical protein